VKIIKKKSLVSLSLLTIFMFLGMASFVLAAVTLPTGDLPTKSPTEILTSILNWISSIVAIVSALVIVIAGIMWATAGGDEERQGKARKMLIAGIIGLVIALAAFGIVTVVVNTFFA